VCRGIFRLSSIDAGPPEVFFWFSVYIDVGYFVDVPVYLDSLEIPIENSCVSEILENSAREGFDSEAGRKLLSDSSAKKIS